MVQYAESWLELEKALGGRSVIKGTPEEMRAQFDGLLGMLAPLYPPPSDAVATKDGEVDGIKYRIYTPVEAAKSGPLPVGVYAHGGGYVLGSLDSEDVLCRAIAENTPSILVSVDYRLAPEHPAPAQIQDCLNVYKWARQNAASYGGDPAKFYAVGGSAGGGLALSMANRVVKDAARRDGCKGVVAVVPISVHNDHVPAEYKSMCTAMEENASGVPVIDAQSMKDFFDATGVKPDDKDYFALLDEENHKNFPPTYICTCEADPLRDDGKAMEAALKKAGVPTKSDYYPGFPHYFWIFPQIPEGQTFVGNLIGGVKWVVGQM